MLIVEIVITILAAMTVWTAIWVLTSFFVGKSKKQEQFVANTAPATGPEGFYRGAAYLLGNQPVPWLGKTFESGQHHGFNVFTPKGASMLKILTPLYKLFRINSDGNTEAYYFKTSIGSGLKDVDTQVFKLDYDSPENPFLIRIILDEMVEVGPNEFLGKVHMKVLPGYYATIGFFGLRK
jgi:hypothetical protein